MYRALFLVFMLFHGLSASATTMTFDEIQPALKPPTTPPLTYTENGITASSWADLGYWSRVGTVHLDDSGTSITSTVSFTTGGRFSAVSFDLFPLGPTALSYELFNIVDWSIIAGHGIPYDNVMVTGFRSGALVAEDSFYSGDFSTYFFDTHQFADLDNLTISAQLPDSSVIESIRSTLLANYPGYIVNSISCFDQPCAHFDIDNLVLDSVTAVPLPASLPLVLLGLSLLTIAHRKFIPTILNQADVIHLSA